MLYTIKTGKCEKFGWYFALEECEKQPEEHMLMHTVQNDSRFRVGTRVGYDGIMNQMLAVPLPGAQSWQQDNERALPAPSQRASSGSFELPPNDGGKTCLKDKNLSSVLVSFPESHFQTCSLWLCENIRSPEVLSGSRTIQGLPSVPHGVYSSLKMQVKSNIRTPHYRPSWQAELGKGELGKGEEECTQSHSRCFPHAFGCFILKTNLRVKSFGHWWQVKCTGVIIFSESHSL